MEEKTEMIKNAIWSLKKLSGDKNLLIAIDGRCGAGKTTLAAKLQEQIDCTVFHMDDFFLRPKQRTRERLATPGGNVDYERFEEEILHPVKEGSEIITYRVFDCKSWELKQPIRIKVGSINLVEGSYSCHPALWSYYDYHIFLNISPEEQLKRIKKRNGEDGAKIFSEKWIPMEENYFHFFRIRERCDLRLETESSVITNPK